jgi:hypothetical protein
VVCSNDVLKHLFYIWSIIFMLSTIWVANNITMDLIKSVHIAWPVFSMRNVVTTNIYVIPDKNYMPIAYSIPKHVPST